MQKVSDRKKLSCPRCDAAGSLSGRDDYYGSYLGCLICGWHGETDENGYTTIIWLWMDIPAVQRDAIYTTNIHFEASIYQP